MAAASVPEVKDASPTNMAATEIEEVKVTNVCLVCFEKADHLKVVGECRHAFCEPCLKKHLENNSGKTFCCPSCQSDCTLPEGGVSNLPDLVLPADQVGAAVRADDGGFGLNAVVLEPVGELPKKDCYVCNSKGTTKTAERYCEKCDVYLCDVCGHIHRDTKKHVVTDMDAATPESAGICRRDGLRLKLYCLSCEVPCCGFCDHDDHDVQPIREVLNTKREELEEVLQDGDRLVGKLEIQEARASAGRKSKAEWMRTVTQDIEEQAEECTNKILKQKTALLEQLQKSCDISAEESCLRDVARIREVINAQIGQGRQLLACETISPGLMRRLDETKARVEKELHSKANEVDPKIFREKPLLFQKECNPVSSIGQMTRKFTKVVKLNELTLPEGATFQSIEAIRCLGETGYAVFCQDEELPGQLLIYGKDGVLKKAEEGLPKVYGVDVDAKDRVVLLLAGEREGVFVFRVYDTTTNASMVSKEFPLTKPLSMAMAPQGWSYVLCEVEGQDHNRAIATVGMEGNGQWTPISCSAVSDHDMITCSGSRIYTARKSSNSPTNDVVAVLSAMEGKVGFLHSVQPRENNSQRGCNFITVSLYGDVFITSRKSNYHSKSEACILNVDSPGNSDNLHCLVGDYNHRLEGKLIHVYNHTLLVKDYRVTAYRLCVN